MGQGALLAVDQTRTFAGHPPRLHSQQAGLRSWLPGHHLGRTPGKASGGFTELLRTGPYLSILKEISPEYSLEGLMLKLKLQYFGHLM